MPPESPAAPLDAANSLMAEAEEAHDKANKRREGPEQGIPQAMHLTNSNLESSQVQSAQTPSNALGAPSPLLLQHHPQDVVDSQNIAGARVTSETYKPTAIPGCAMNEGNTPDPGMMLIYIGKSIW
jgi:hypothetical protein